jgi:hypothetical protein
MEMVGKINRYGFVLEPSSITLYSTSGTSFTRRRYSHRQYCTVSNVFVTIQSSRTFVKVITVSR